MEVKLEPDLDNLCVAKITSEITQLCQVHFEVSIVPTLAHSPAIYRNLVLCKNSLIAKLENRLDQLLEMNLKCDKHSNTACYTWIEHILAKQKKTDFKSKEETGKTECTMVFEFQLDMLVNLSIFGDHLTRNLEKFRSTKSKEVFNRAWQFYICCIGRADA